MSGAPRRRVVADPPPGRPITSLVLAQPIRRGPGRPPGSKNRASRIDDGTIQREANALLAVAKQTRHWLESTILAAAHEAEERGHAALPSKEFLDAFRMCRETIRDLGHMSIQLQSKQLKDAANLSDDELADALNEQARAVMLALPLEELEELLTERRAAEGGAHDEEPAEESTAEPANGFDRHATGEQSEHGGNDAG